MSGGIQQHSEFIEEVLTPNYSAQDLDLQYQQEMVSLVLVHVTISIGKVCDFVVKY